MNRVQWTLTGVLGVQLLLLLVLAPWSTDSDAAGPQPLLPILAEAAPTRIEIGREVDDESESIVIERSDEGWILPGHGGYPADAEEVRDVLRDLGAVEVRRPVVSSARYHEAMKVTEREHERRVRLWEDDGAPIVDLFLGTSPNYQVSNVRRAGEDAVYEARGLSQWDMRTDAASWVEKSFVDVEFEDVISVSVRNVHGPLSLERDTADESAGGWRLVSSVAGKPLDDGKIDSFVRALAGLQLSAPAGRADDPAFGLGEPFATVELAYTVAAPPVETAEGETPVAPDPEVRTVGFSIGGPVMEPDDAGADVDSGKRYASLDGSEFAVILSKWDVEKITGKRPEDLEQTDE